MAAIKILLVDDDETQNFIMRNLLEREGFDITLARNAAEALRLISSERYDVLLSDLHMPGAADGLTVVAGYLAPRPGVRIDSRTSGPRGLEEHKHCVHRRCPA
jgi:CheY-like chemotaxis protein